MDLLKFIKKNLFIQNFVASIFSLLPPYLENSIAKYSAIKKAFYLTAHDATFGDYLEFGVFTGSSFNFAMKINIYLYLEYRQSYILQVYFLQESFWHQK